MLLLADENIARVVVVALRDMGHEVLWAAEAFPSLPDEDVARRAAAEGRIAVTHDKGFGNLAVRLRLPIPGLIILDLHTLSPEATSTRVRDVLTSRLQDAHGAVLVIEPARVRRRLI